LVTKQLPTKQINNLVLAFLVNMQLLSNQSNNNKLACSPINQPIQVKVPAFSVQLLRQFNTNPRQACSPINTPAQPKAFSTQVDLPSKYCSVLSQKNSRRHLKTNSLSATFKTRSRS